MVIQQTNDPDRIVRRRRLVLLATLPIAAILAAVTAEYPASGSWQLPAICLGMYAIAFFLVAVAPPGVGGGYIIAISALLAAGSGLLAFELWALAQGEVSTARDRQTVWLGAAACLGARGHGGSGLVHGGCAADGRCLGPRRACITRLDQARPEMP